jgi:hypothetical protein
LQAFSTMNTKRNLCVAILMTLGLALTRGNLAKDSQSKIIQLRKHSVTMAGAIANSTTFIQLDQSQILLFQQEAQQAKKILEQLEED